MGSAPWGLGGRQQRNMQHIYVSFPLPLGPGAAFGASALTPGRSFAPACRGLGPVSNIEQHVYMNVITRKERPMPESGGRVHFAGRLSTRPAGPGLASNPAPCPHPTRRVAICTITASYAWPSCKQIGPVSAGRPGRQQFRSHSLCTPRNRPRGRCVIFQVHFKMQDAIRFEKDPSDQPQRPSEGSNFGARTCGNAAGPRAQQK